MERELLRIPEVGEVTGLSRAKIYQLIAAGEIGPVIKVGRASRIRISDVRAWIERRVRDSEGRGAA